ncbi:MAG: Catabolite control protein A [Anaerolineales bacterium]|nr:Catabolite control protein A [Anaerolineales bacterium]
MPVTLRDIAQETGYSVTTVSRALNDYDDVSPKTRRTICETAERLGYHPNITAQHLQRQRTDTLGFIIPTTGPRFSDPFFTEFLAGIGNEASAQGYDLLVSTHSAGPGELDVYRRFVRGKRVDGLLVVRTRRHDSRISYLLEQHFPFVAFGRTECNGNFPFVDEDGRAGIARATQHLIDHGHRRIAFIAADQDLMFGHERLRGYTDTMRENNLPVDDGLIVEGDLSQRSGRRAARRLLDLPETPTAIMASNDLMALGAMATVQAHGFEVGKDVAVTGFDDIPLAEHSHPPLTTVRQPIYRIGEMVCQVLVDLIRGGPLKRRHVILEPTLIVRQSSAPAASSATISVG